MKNISAYSLRLSAVIVVLASVVLIGCDKSSQGDVTPHAIVRLDRVMNRYKTLDSVSRVAVRDSFAPELVAMTQVLGLDGDDDASLMAWSNSDVVGMFTPMVEEVFPDVTALERSIAVFESRAADEGLAIPARRYAAVVWGRPESVVFNDSIGLIALNHYLGADNEAYSHWPEYRRANKRPGMLPYDIVEATVATAYPYAPVGDGATVLSRMIYEGVLAEAKMRLVENANLADALGFSTEQLADLRQNRAFMWNTLITGKMLYSKDADLIDRLFSPLPVSTPISPDAPGRAVRFSGYEIVRGYLDRNPSTTLADMLSPNFYSSPSTLQASAYAPTSTEN